MFEDLLDASPDLRLARPGVRDREAHIGSSWLCPVAGMKSSRQAQSWLRLHPQLSGQLIQALPAVAASPRPSSGSPTVAVGNESVSLGRLELWIRSPARRGG
jgi:hypothetical protein